MEGRLSEDYIVIPDTPTVFERDTPVSSGLVDARGVPLRRPAVEPIGFLAGVDTKARGRRGGRRNSGGRRMMRGGRRMNRGRRRRR